MEISFIKKDERKGILMVSSVFIAEVFMLLNTGRKMIYNDLCAKIVVEHSMIYHFLL